MVLPHTHHNPSHELRTLLRRSAVLATLVVFIWVGLEWLFFLTKPSFMTLYRLHEALGVLTGNALILSSSLLLVSMPFITVAWVLNRIAPKLPSIALLGLVPSLILITALAYLLVDNFTLTLFGWGIRDSAGLVVWGYRALGVIVLALAARTFYRYVLGRLNSTVPEAIASIAGIGTLVGLPFFVVSLSETVAARPESGSEAMTELPNIVWVSGDGIQAEHMSAYGYERPTTPFLDQVKGEFLIAENSFANAANTGGSVMSMLSGKHPTSTRVIYPPDVFRGVDSYQHLPGMLRKLGYYTADISVRHYADPFDLNLRGGFIEANSRKIDENRCPLILWMRSRPSLNSTTLLTERMFERVWERLAHIWLGRPMRNPLDTVKRPERYGEDANRISQMNRLLSQQRWPFFLHMHLMGTHGPRFLPRRRIFSAAASFYEDWNIDAYDDAILDFDTYVRQIYYSLKRLGLLESTVLVITADHGYRFNPVQRIPLMLRFPQSAPQNPLRGWLQGNTQLLDIAPTLVDYLEVEIPVWMEGASLLTADRSVLETRPIYATRSAATQTDGVFWSVSKSRPPWYSLGSLYLVHCDRAFRLGLPDFELETQKVEGSSVQCHQAIGEDEAERLMLEHLRQRGYQFESGSAPDS